MNEDRILETIQLTEKGTGLREKYNQYLFKVHPAANKIEIKRAVESQFKVQVARVNVMNYRGKLRRERTAQFGRRPNWKRAVVTLKEGNSIDLT